MAKSKNEVTIKVVATKDVLPTSIALAKIGFIKTGFKIAAQSKPTLKEGTKNKYQVALKFELESFSFVEKYLIPN